VEQAVRIHGMQLTQDQLKHIEAVKSTMKCPMDFKCERSRFNWHPKVKRVGGLLECLEEDAEYCPFSFGCGLGNLCRCPLNMYIQTLSLEKAVY
jgi:hypothetical protein